MVGLLTFSLAFLLGNSYEEEIREDNHESPVIEHIPNRDFTRLAADSSETEIETLEREIDNHPTFSRQVSDVPPGERKIKSSVFDEEEDTSGKEKESEEEQKQQEVDVDKEPQEKESQIEQDRHKETAAQNEETEEEKRNDKEEGEEERETFRGVASWYGPGFHGSGTASGETFNQNAKTAAHPELPFGTEVKVTFLRTGKSTEVRINDRGPFTGGRIIDLSRAAAEAIGLKSHGIGEVKVEVLEP